MDYRRKNLASARVARKLGAAISAVALAGPAVLPALQPMMALAASKSVSVVGLTVSADPDEATKITWFFGSSKRGSREYSFVRDGQGGFKLDTAGLSEADAKKLNEDLAGETIGDFLKVTVTYDKFHTPTSTVAISVTGQTATFDLDSFRKVNGIAARKDGETDEQWGARLSAATTKSFDFKSTQNNELVIHASSMPYYFDNDSESYKPVANAAAISWYTQGLKTPTDQPAYKDLDKFVCEPLSGYEFDTWLVLSEDPNNAEITDYEKFVYYSGNAEVDKEDIDSSIGMPPYEDLYFVPVVKAANYTVSLNAGSAGALPEKSKANYDLTYLDHSSADYKALFETGVVPIGAENSDVFDGWRFFDGQKTIPVSGADGKFGSSIEANLVDFAKASEGPAYVYALWHVNGSVEVTVANSNTAAGTIVRTDGGELKLPSTDTSYYDLKAVPADGNGYEFAGWYAGKTAETATKLVSPVPVLSAQEQRDNLLVDADNKPTATTYVAKWNAADELLITFDPNGATLKSGAKALGDVEWSVENPNNLWTKTAVDGAYELTGFEFKGWSVTPEGKEAVANLSTGKVDTAGQKALLGDDFDGSVYAIWQLASGYSEYTFEANPSEGGKVSTTAGSNDIVTNKALAFGFKATAEADPSYSFTGWYTRDAKGDLSAKAYKTATELTRSDVTASSTESAARTHEFVAVFAPHSYTVKFSTDTKPRSYTVGVDAEFPAGEWLVNGTVVKSKAELDKLATEDGIALTAEPVVKARGWYRAADGRWHYEKQMLGGIADVKSDWVKDNGLWYYLKSDGAMARDQWIKDAGKWYYLGGDGVMLRSQGLKWQDHWYWLKDWGDMAQDEIINIGYGPYEYNHAGEWVAYEQAKRA